MFSTELCFLLQLLNGNVTEIFLSYQKIHFFPPQAPVDSSLTVWHQTHSAVNHVSVVDTQFPVSLTCGSPHSD